FVAGDAASLRSRELRRDHRRVAHSRFHFVLVDDGFDRPIRDAGRVEHLPPDRAGRGKDEAQSNNLVEKGPGTASASLGTGSTGDLRSPAQALFEDSSTGKILVPRL